MTPCNLRTKMKSKKSPRMRGSRCAHCEDFGPGAASALWHKIEVSNPQDPERLEADYLANVGRLYDRWFASRSGGSNAEFEKRKTPDMRELLRTDAFRQIQASTDCRLLMHGRDLGQTNFPGCVSPHQPRDGNPAEDDYVDSDFCAVYFPEWRKLHPKEIWISVRGAASFARSLSRVSSETSMTEETCGICRVFLYHHEVFHFNVERALRRLAGNVGGDRLWWNAYVASWGTYDCIEEGMAEAFALQRVKRLPARYQRYLEPLQTLILKSTPGYSSGVAIAERYAEFKRFFFRKVATVTGMDAIHETAFLEMLENETPPESKVFYVMPVTREQKREISDCSGTSGIKVIAADTAQATGLENILDW